MKRWHGESAVAFQVARLIEADGDMCAICGFFLGDPPLDDAAMAAWADARPVVEEAARGRATGATKRLVHAWCHGVRDDAGESAALTSAQALAAIAEDLRRAQAHLGQFRALAKKGRQ